MVEALADLGGLILLVGAVLFGAQYWPDLGTGSRLAVLAFGTLVLFGAGLAIPARGGAARRARSALWVLSAGCAAAFFAILGNEALDLAAKNTVLLTGLGTTAYAAVLWFWQRTAVQEAAVLVATLVVAGAVGAHLPGTAWVGVGVWCAAAVWLVLARIDRVPAVRTTQTLAAAGLVLGAGLTIDLDVGIAFALLTSVALVSAGIAWREVGVALLGAVGLIQFLPAAVNDWFSDRAAAPLALVVGGGVLVGAAVALARMSAMRSTAGDEPAIDPDRYDAVLLELDEVLLDVRPSAVEVDVHPDALHLVDRLEAAGLSYAVVSARRDCAQYVELAGLTERFPNQADRGAVGDVDREPDLDVLLVAAHRLGVQPRRTVVLTSAETGPAAGRDGGFGLVIVVDRSGRGSGTDQLVSDMAASDLVVSDLSQLVVIDDGAQPQPHEPAR